MTKSNSEDGGTTFQTEEQLDFFFWLGADGVLDTTTPEEFETKQREWQGPRPSDYIEGL